MKFKSDVQKKIRELKSKHQEAKACYLVVLAMTLKAQIEMLQWVLED